METSWLEIRVEPSSDPQPVIDALFAAGSLAVHEDRGALVTQFPPGTDASRIESVVLERDSGARVTARTGPDPDTSQWRAAVRSHSLGRITVAPPWLATDSCAEVTVVIEPAMAFGTGEHATTRGVVRLMQRLRAMPRVVADVGAGSAVLAICAAKLGAEKALAIELDPDAIGNAEENVRANGVSDSVTVMQGDAAVLLPLVAPVGLVLANIISSVLLELLPAIRESLLPGGDAILSGILLEEREMLMHAIDRGDWIVAAEDTEEGWWSVLISRPR